MKIIACNRFLGQNDSICDIDVIPDSAMILPGKPLFIPDFGEGDWMGTVSMAFHINRLGKNISPRFASRYYDRFTLALRAFPTGMGNDMTRRGFLSACDGTFYHGEWCDIPIVDSVSVSGQGYNLRIPMADVAIDNVIANVSRYMTVKTGDIILASLLPLTLNLYIDSQLSLLLDNIPCFNLRIK